MFHNTHIYITTQAQDSTDDLLVLGSVLPDLAITGVLAWDSGLHDYGKVEQFVKSILDKGRSSLLLTGLQSHLAVDALSHETYSDGVGYAYLHTEVLSKHVGELYGLDPQKAKQIAHNYIESAVDIHLLKDRSIRTDYLKSVEEESVVYVSRALSTFFDVKYDLLLNSFHQYIDLFTKYDYSSKDDWAKFWNELEPLLGLKDIGHAQRMQLIQEAMGITKISYSDFLARALKE